VKGSNIRGRVTEKTFYRFIIEVVEEYGGSGVSEIRFNSEPDIVFDFLDIKWLMPVKIGEDNKTIKDNFISYCRHRRESGINSGILLFLPKEARSISPEDETLRRFIRRKKVTALIDTELLQDGIRDTLPEIFEFIIEEMQKKTIKPYPLGLIINLLRQHIEDMMKEITLTESDILRIITNLDLFLGIGAEELLEKKKEESIRFLSSYIILSQLLFLRFYSEAHPEIMQGFTKPTKEQLRKIFERIKDINYRPIYEIDILDSIPEEYVSSAFELIQGLRIERQIYEIPGRLFHELMPKKIRKMLAAFYTRPQAAEILANLVIEKPNDIVFDPACGSGTILTSLYRRKRELFDGERNPHRQFCEEEIFGCDIMPFAVHLSGANLASLDVSETIDRTQIILGDSLKLSLGKALIPGIASIFLPTEEMAYKRTGEEYIVKPKEVDVIAMNPPFTKVERGIHKYIDMTRFKKNCGGEVGLWGHFIILAHEFLKERGLLGAILPINFLRGRESNKVREFIFSNYSPLFILKPTFNYGFTEWTEYRDIILVARKGKKKNYDVKFCLIRKDISKLSKEEIRDITEAIKVGKQHKFLDMRSFSCDEIKQHFCNLMWFCGISNFEHRDILIAFLEKFNLKKFPNGYFKEGFRPVPKGVSSFLFITRDNIRGLDNIIQACGFNKNKLSGNFWQDVKEELERTKTNLVCIRRINPYSPNTHLVAFFSENEIYPSNQLNVIKEEEKDKAKAVCALLNSAIFLSYFFLLKEETTGRYIDIRFYDLEEMGLYPTEASIVEKLVNVYDKFKSQEFPSLREQLDLNFEARYKAFWQEKRKKQLTLGEIEHNPSPLRLKFDMEICEALGVSIKEDELKRVYDVIVKEMIITRGLKRD